MGKIRMSVFLMRGLYDKAGKRLKKIKEQKLFIPPFPAVYPERNLLSLDFSVPE